MLFFILLMFIISEIIPSDTQEELRQTYSALCELLRHYWACFPTSSKFLEEKVWSLVIKTFLIRCKKMSASIFFFFFFFFKNLTVVITFTIIRFLCSIL